MNIFQDAYVSPKLHKEGPVCYSKGKERKGKMKFFAGIECSPSISYFGNGIDSDHLEQVYFVFLNLRNLRKSTASFFVYNYIINFL